MCDKTKYNDSWWKNEEPKRYDDKGRLIWWDEDEEIIEEVFDKDSWWKDDNK